MTGLDSGQSGVWCVGVFASVSCLEVRCAATVLCGCLVPKFLPGVAPALYAYDGWLLRICVGEC